MSLSTSQKTKQTNVKGIEHCRIGHVFEGCEPPFFGVRCESVFRSKVHVGPPHPRADVLRHRPLVRPDLRVLDRALVRREDGREARDAEHAQVRDGEGA